MPCNRSDAGRDLSLQPAWLERARYDSLANGKGPARRVLLSPGSPCFDRTRIAATCEKDELASVGGNAGVVLFERSREAPIALSIDVHTTGRRKITLATEPLRQLNPIDCDDE